MMRSLRSTIFSLGVSLVLDNVMPSTSLGQVWDASGNLNAPKASVFVVGEHHDRQPCPQRPRKVLAQPGEKGASAAYLWLVNHCDALKPPTNLQATEASGPSVGLTWTAPNGAAVVDHYEIWRTLSGSSTLIGTATTSSYSDTTVSTSLIPLYEYRARAVDATNHAGGYSNIAIADTSVPTSPSNLTATMASISQINLSWSASTDNGNLAGYKIERCQGSGCSNFAQVATVAVGTTTYNNTGLSGNSSYTYRVRSYDLAGNQSSYSPNGSAMTAAYLFTISNSGVLTVTYEGQGDDFFYLQSPNSTSWKILANGTTGVVTATDGLSGSPSGRALTAPNSHIWDFAISNAGIVSITERP